MNLKFGEKYVLGNRIEIGMVGLLEAISGFSNTIKGE